MKTHEDLHDGHVQKKHFRNQELLKPNLHRNYNYSLRLRIIWALPKQRVSCFGGGGANQNMVSFGCPCHIMWAWHALSPLDFRWGLESTLHLHQSQPPAFKPKQNDIVPSWKQQAICDFIAICWFYHKTAWFCTFFPQDFRICFCLKKTAPLHPMFVPVKISPDWIHPICISASGFDVLELKRSTPSFSKPVKHMENRLMDAFEGVPACLSLG